MAPSALPGSESAPSPRATAPSGGVGPIAPAACHKSLNGKAPRLTIAALGNVPSRSGSSTKPSATGTLSMVRASRSSPSGRLSPSVLISARPGTDPSRRAGERRGRAVVRLGEQHIDCNRGGPPGRHSLDEPCDRLPRPRPGAQCIDGRTINVDNDYLQV